jgi:hypothetical protein
MVDDHESTLDVETAPSIPLGESGFCSACDQQTSRRCSECESEWFCSVQCENEMTNAHQSQCSFGALTTADYLYMAIWKG